MVADLSHQTFVFKTAEIYAMNDSYQDSMLFSVPVGCSVGSSVCNISLSRNVQAFLSSMCLLKSLINPLPNATRLAMPPALFQLY